jgi:hypothetical protein
MSLRSRLPLVLFLVAFGAAAHAANGDADRLRAQVDESAPTTVSVQLADGTTRSLTLLPFQVFSADAEIVVMREDGVVEHRKPPRTRHFRVRPEPDAPLGFVEVDERGRIGGILRDHGGLLAVSGDDDGGLQARPPRQAKRDDASFDCAAEGEHFERDLAGMNDALTTARTVTGAGAPYTARIALETDNEFLNLFGGNTTNATTYVTALMAFISSIYQVEVNTELTVSYLRFWDGITDPYAEGGNTSCMLLEFGKYWNDHQAAVTPRTTAHLLSGKAMNAGIAWVGVLCSGPFSTSAAQIGASCPNQPGTHLYGGAYGLTAGLDANFVQGAPTPVWDVDAVAHEIGHNFNSPHTHCYSPPVDQCYGSENNCYIGSTSLPGPQGQGSGTIMSYCHLRPGGLGNITMTFGTGHAFGTDPGRVPLRMIQHVTSRPPGQCLAPLQNELLEDGFE